MSAPGRGFFPTEYVPLIRSSSKRPNSPSLPTPTAPPQSTSTGKVKRGRKSAAETKSTISDGPMAQSSSFPVSLSRESSSRERSAAITAAGISNSSGSNDGGGSALNGGGGSTSTLIIPSSSQGTSDFAALLRQNVPTSGLKSLGGLGAITWTEAEDAELSHAIAAVGTSDWTAVAQFVPRRTAQQCMSRWLRALKQGEVKKDWNPIEDEMIKSFVQKSGDPSKVVWTEIAQKLEGRIGKQCRERWFFHLDPNLKRTPFDEEEDRRLFEAQRALGNKWSEIARLLPGRNENSVKNRWNSVARRKWFVDHGLPLAERDALALMQHAKLSHLDWKVEENLKLASRNASPELSFMSGRSYEIGVGWTSGPIVSGLSTSLSLSSTYVSEVPVSSVLIGSSTSSYNNSVSRGLEIETISQPFSGSDRLLLASSSSTRSNTLLPSSFSLNLSPAETFILCSVETDSVIIYRMCGELPQIRLRLQSKLSPDDAPLVPYSYEIGTLFHSAGILFNIKNTDADVVAPLSTTMRDLVVFPTEEQIRQPLGEKRVSQSSALFGAHGTQWIFDTTNNEYLFVKSGRRPGALSSADSATSPDGFSSGFKVASGQVKKSVRKLKPGTAEMVTSAKLISSVFLPAPTSQELLLLSDGRLKISPSEDNAGSSWSVPLLSPDQMLVQSPDAEPVGGPIDRFQSIQPTDVDQGKRGPQALSNNESQQDWQVNVPHQRKESISMDLASPSTDRHHLVRTLSSGSNGGSAPVHFTLQPFVLQKNLPFSEQFSSIGDGSASTSFVVPALPPRPIEHSRSAPTFLSSADLNRESASGVFINALSSPNSCGSATPGSKSKPPSDLPSPIDISNLFEFKHVSSPKR